MQFLKRLDTLTTKFTPQSPPSYDQQLLDRAEVLARTVISQQSFYQSPDCSDKQRQLLETMVGAAIWYLPQGEDLWTGCISLQALSQLANADKPKSVKLTKDHHFPRKVAAAELWLVPRGLGSLGVNVGNATSRENIDSMPETLLLM